MANKIKQYRPRGLKARTLDKRESASVRGYDRRWQRLRKAVLRDWVEKNGPYCGTCGTVLDFDRGTHVDHIKRHEGQTDPMFWKESNLQVLCRECHARKTRLEEQ